MKKLVSMLVLTALVVSACNLVRDEKQAFIDASVEATCLLFQSNDVLDPSMETKAKEVFEKFGFDTDEESLKALTEKYKGDEEVESALVEGVSKCSEGYLDVAEEETVNEEVTEAVSEEAPEASGEESTEVPVEVAPVEEVTP